MEKYPKVYALGHKYIQDIFEDEVLVEEKVDGSCLNFSKGVDNSINIFSRTVKQDLDNPDKMFKVGVEYILSIQDKLIPGFNYHGEYLNKPKHNTLPYGRVPKNNIIIFDIEDVNGEPLSYDAKVEEAALLGLETVPRLFYGKLLNATELFKYLDNISILGNEKIEGVVVKNYNKYTQFKNLGYSNYYVGKFVSERFKEKHVKDWKERNISNKDIISNLITELKTEARWYKAVQHLKESGKFLGEPKDIGELFKLVTMDIDEEEQDYIKDVLYKHFVKDIKRHVTHGLPEWYKIKLAEGGL